MRGENVRDKTAKRHSSILQSHMQDSSRLSNEFDDNEVFKYFVTVAKEQRQIEKDLDCAVTT